MFITQNYIGYIINKRICKKRWFSAHICALPFAVSGRHKVQFFLFGQSVSFYAPIRCYALNAYID